MVVKYKSTYTERDTEHCLKKISTLEASFGAKPNVLQFCPLCNVYVVNVVQPIVSTMRQGTCYLCTQHLGLIALTSLT
jgi:hypothetical protein